MTEAPSIKEALEQLVDALEMDYPERPTRRNALPPSALTFVMISQAKAALATLSPPAGERREAIALALAEKWPGDYMQGDDECEREPNELAYETADLILASGLVQDEAGWRDISTAPKDGTPFIGAFWSIRRADSHRKGDVVTCWWQPEFDAFISSCREMSLAPGLTFENGETRQLHSPVIEPVTHWKPLDRPPIRSACDGGAES